MASRGLALVAGTLILLLAACSETGILSPLSDTGNQATVTSVPNGTMVSSGSSLPLTVRTLSGQAAPADLKVEIVDQDGNTVQTSDVRDVDFTAPLPPLQLSSLPSGTYTVKLTLTDASGNVLAQSSQSIFYVSGTYALDGINSYPPTLPPGGSGVLVARTEEPSGSNPYLRWTMGGKLVAEGYLADGYDQVQWTAPQTAGVYSVSVELFPFGPQAGTSFTFTSPYTMKVEIFVSASAGTSKDELGPASSYYALYHFEGNLKDSSGSGFAADATAIGNPQLSVNGSMFGYQLDGSSGFRIPALIVPTDAGGTLKPFSVTVSIHASAIAPNRDIFQTRNDAGDFSFWMGTDASGNLQASIDGQNEPGDVAWGAGDVHAITLSVEPGSRSTGLLWFVDGQLSLVDALPPVSRLHSSTGQSTIGGTNGIAALIDEFGVYDKDSQGRSAVDPDVFRRVMTQDFGASLLFAEGFDGLTLPDDLGYGHGVDASQLANGSLALSSGQTIELPAITVPDDPISVVIQLPGFPGGANASLTVGTSGTNTLTIPLARDIDNSGQAEIKLTKSDNGLQVTDASGTRVLPGSVSSLDITLSNDGGVDVPVRSVMVVKSRSWLSKASEASLVSVG